MSCLVISSPMPNKRMPQTLLTIILVRAQLIFPVLNKLKFSNAKLAKVVNAPNIPVKIKSLVVVENAKKSDKPNRIPATKEPNKLTVKVPNGNVLAVDIVIAYLITYREIAPIAPPAAILAI